MVPVLQCDKHSATPGAIAITITEIVHTTAIADMHYHWCHFYNALMDYKNTHRQSNPI